MEVEYRSCECVGFPLYRVGSDMSIWSRWTKGRARVTNSWHRRKWRVRPDGRKFVTLCSGTRHENFLASRLILWCFKGPPPDGKPECRHLDANPENDSPDNLAWGDRRDQYDDMVRCGTFRHGTPDNRGERCGAAKLTEADIPAIRARLRTGHSRRRVATAYGVARQTIDDIANKVTWTCVPEIITDPFAD